jgi:hypothetical protein
MSDYNFRDELKLKSSTYSFSEQMQHDALNDFWKRKEGLWTLLSAACDDAAKKYFEHMESYATDFLDIETCNIHALKSIAKSVDLEFLVKHIKEDYPDDILKLLNLLSIPRYILLNTNRILHDDANLKLFGSITKRASEIFVDNVPIDLLYDIKTHIYDILNVLRKFMINESFSISKVLKYNLPDLRIGLSNFNYSLTNFNVNTIFDFSFDVNDKTLQEIMDDPDLLEYYILNLNLIDIYKAIDNLNIDNLKYYEDQKLKVSVFDFNGVKRDVINPFYILINVIKQNFFNKEGNFILDGKYYNDEINDEVDIADLITRIVSPIHNDDRTYLNHFINYHFYNVIKEKLFNDNLKKLYVFPRNDNDYDYIDKNRITDSFDGRIYFEQIKMIDNTYSEYTKEEFTAALSKFFTADDIEIFIKQNKIVHYTKDIVNFVEYLCLINQFIYEYNDKLTIEDFDIIRINFPNKFAESETLKTNIYKRLFDDETKNDACLVNVMAKEFSDLAMEITYLREEIQENVLRYGYIGTKKLVVNVLNDYFIRSFYNKLDWSFQNNIKIDGSDNITNSLSLPISSFLNLDKSLDKLSIDLIEYYDTTEYMNIKSDLGKVKTGEVQVGTEKVVKYNIGSDNLIVSSYVDVPVMQDVYTPCSVFLTTFNNRFWESDLNDINETNILDYEQFFGQYISLDDHLISENIEKIQEMQGTFSRIWDAFALSGFSGNENNDIACLFTKYIGTDDGTNKYQNLKNEIFPTIAAATNIDGLVEIDNYEDEILFVTKLYYSKVIELIKGEKKYSTLDMLKMYNKDGISYNNWKQSYIPFHGYSPKYTYSSKIAKKNNKEDKNVNIDGPWSYSHLQKILFTKISNNSKIKIESIVSNELVTNINNPDKLAKKYVGYILDNDVKTSLFLNESENFIGNYKIEKIEKDIFLNSFFLLKNKYKDDVELVEDESSLSDKELIYKYNYGKLFFRSHEMSIALPLMNIDDDSFGLINDSNLNSNTGKNSYDENVNKANKSLMRSLSIICNNCVDFGIYEDFIWIHGYDTDSETYKIISFKYDYENGMLTIFKDDIGSSLKIITGMGALALKMEYLNDFVGVIKNEEANELSFIFCDIKRLLNNATREYSRKIGSFRCLSNSNIDLYITTINIDNFSIEPVKRVVELKNTVFPALLDPIEFRNESGLNNKLVEICNDHKLWKINKVEDKQYLCYEAINLNELDVLGLDYINFNEDNLDFEVITIQWPSLASQNNVSDKGLINPSLLTISKTGKETIVIESLENFTKSKKISILSSSLKQLFDSYPRCYYKNGILNMDFLPFSLDSSFKEKELETNLIHSIISAYFDNTIDKNYLTFYSDANSEGECFNDLVYNRLIRGQQYNKLALDYYNRNLEIMNFLKGDDNNLNERITNDLISSFVDCSFAPGKIDDTYVYNSNGLYEIMPLTTRCLLEPLKIKIMWKNSTGITFTHDFAMDVDVTCYINDIIESQKRVGYGNRYKETSYIKWSGDNSSSGFEDFEIDVQKYIRNKFENNDINTNMEIVLNVCWFETAQLMNSDLIAQVTWRNISEEIQIRNFGVNNKSCDNRSLILNIDMKTGNLTYDEPSYYIALKFAKKRVMSNYDEGIPDIQAGYISLTQRELNELDKLNEKWDNKKDKNYLIYNNTAYSTGKSGIIEYTTVLFKNMKMYNVNNKNIVNIFKSILKEIIKIDNKVQGIKKSFNELLLDEIYFGSGFENLDEETNVQYVYYVYLIGKYFKPYNHNHDLSKMYDEFDKSFQLSVGLDSKIKRCIE